MPVLRSDGSSAISFMERIGPHGMSCSLRMSIASNLVLVFVHSSIWSKISNRCGSRAFGVAYRGSVSHSSWPITLQMASQTGACVMK